MKARVPSIGSRTQTNSASVRSAPFSSPSMPCAGYCVAIRARIDASASRSAIVTGEASAFSSIATVVRKYFRTTAPAAFARRWENSTYSAAERADELGLPMGCSVSRIAW